MARADAAQHRGEPSPALGRRDQPQRWSGLGIRAQRQIRPRRGQQRPRAIGRATADHQLAAQITPAIHGKHGTAQLTRRADQTNALGQRVDNMSSTTVDCSRRWPVMSLAMPSVPIVVPAKSRARGSPPRAGPRAAWRRC